jgi:hypothetical protein
MTTDPFSYSLLMVLLFLLQQTELQVQETPLFRTKLAQLLNTEKLVPNNCHTSSLLVVVSIMAYVCMYVCMVV